jgi:uncharacterized YigZ family protein
MADSADARYVIPARTHRIEHVIERSRFIATVGRAGTTDEASAFVRAVSDEFPDATHNCWAYVVGAPGSTGRIGMSDAGEPHGTAGRPMLTVLLHSGVGDVVAVVTRYFGGVKLGTGGLARAYAGAVKEALESLPRGERVTWAALVIRVDYAAVTVLQQQLARHEAQVDEERYTDAVTYRVRVPAPRADALRAALADATTGRAVVEAEAVAGE